MREYAKNVETMVFATFAKKEKQSQVKNDAVFAEKNQTGKTENTIRENQID